jgi:hypothetical protein
MRAFRIAPALLALALILGSSAVAGAGTITGRVFTAESADSVAKGATVVLVYPGSDGQMNRAKALTDESGHFHFMDVSQDTSIAYVLQITLHGRDFLSGAIKFEPGQSEIDYSVLLTDESPDGGDLPSGHPPLSGQQPPRGVALRPNPVHAVLIVLWIALVFGLLAIMARPRRGSGEGSEAPAAVRTLVRDIASLDLRHEDGVIGDDEYRKVREGLMARLRSLSQRTSV